MKNEAKVNAPAQYMLPAVNCGNMYQAPAGLRAMAEDDGVLITPSVFQTMLGFSTSGRHAYTSDTMIAQPEIVVFVRTTDIHRKGSHDTYGMELSVLGPVRLLDDIPAVYAEEGVDVIECAHTIGMQGNNVEAMRIILTFGSRCLTYLVGDHVVLVIEYNPEFFNIPALIINGDISDSDGTRWEECDKVLKGHGYAKDSQQLAYTVSAMLSDIEYTQVHNVVSLHGVTSMTLIKYADANGVLTEYITAMAEVTSARGTYSFHESTGADVCLSLVIDAATAKFEFEHHGFSTETFHIPTILNVEAAELKLGFITRSEGDKYYMDYVCHTDPDRAMDLQEMVHGVTDAAFPKYIAILAATFIIGDKTETITLPVRTCLV